MAFISPSPVARTDFRKLAIPVTPSQAGSYLLNQIHAGTDVALAIDSGGTPAMLDETADRLAGTRTRVLRAAPTGDRGLTLSSLVNQIADQASIADRGGDVQTKGYRALTQLDKTCDRIALLVADAQMLDRNAVDYLKLVRREDAPLSLVLAGSPALFGVLDEQKLRTARARVKSNEAAEPPPIIPADAAAAPRPIPVALQEPFEAEPTPAEPVYTASAPATQAQPARIHGWFVAAGAFGAGVLIALAFGAWFFASRQPQTAMQARPPTNPAPALAVPPPAAGDTALPYHRLDQPPVVSNPSPPAPKPSAVATTPPGSGPALQTTAGDRPPPPPTLSDNPSEPDEVDGIPVPPMPPALTGSPDLSEAAPTQPNAPDREHAARPTRAMASPPPRPLDNPAQVWDTPSYSPDQPVVGYQPPPEDSAPRPPAPSQSYIGTFTTDAAGNRVFRLNR